MTPTIRPRLTMSKMAISKPKKELPISDDNSFELRKLEIYRQYFEGLRPFRNIRERAARYFNGDQWHEMIEDKFGDMIREDEYILNQGKTPLKQNLIKSTIRSLEGQFRIDASKSVVVARTPEKSKESEMLSNALQYVLSSVNNAKEIDSRLLEEFLISGLPIQRISWEFIPELKRKDVVVRNINPNSIFFNNDIEDIRGHDIRVIGRLMDLTLDELVVFFGSTKERTTKLKEIYRYVPDEYLNQLGITQDRQYLKDFYFPYDVSKCRVIEIWEKRLVTQMEVHDWMDGRKFYTDWDQKKLDQANAFRVSQYAQVGVSADEVPILEGTPENVQKWFFTYYSPYGHILKEGETPFEHGSHPFIVTPYPLLDSNIQGIATDLIDAQRQINRLLILQDMILSSSVKNTLIVDSGSMNGQSLEQIAESYKEIGGVIALDLKRGEGQPPVELKGAIGNMGISEMIQIYIRMLQDVSGVNPAMQGQQAQSGTSGKLYDAQISQSTLNSKDMMDTFTGLFRRNRDMKLLKTIQQFYEEPRMIAIAGKSYSETAMLYLPDSVRDIDFDLTIGQTADSPVYRTMMDETLNNFVMKGLIDIEMWAESTSMPFAQTFLESLRKRKEQAQTDPQGAVAGLSGDAQTAGVGGDPSVINQTYEGMRR